MFASRILRYSLLVVFSCHEIASAAPIYSVVMNQNFGATSSGPPQSPTSYAAGGPLINNSGQLLYGKSTSVGLGSFITTDLRFRSGVQDISVTSSSYSPTSGGTYTGGFSLNDSGQYIYSKFNLSGNNLNYVQSYRAQNGGNAQAFTLSAQTPSAVWFSDRSLNNLGQISYRDGTNTKVFLPPSTSTTLSFGAANTTVTPSINNNGVVSFLANQSPFIQLKETFSPFDTYTAPNWLVSQSNFNRSLPINDSNQMILWDAGNILYRWQSGGSPEPLIGLQGPVLYSINNLGDVLMQSPFGSNPIYFLPAGNSQIIRLLGAGDSFGGSTIRSVIVSQDSINDSRNVALSYTLNNGTYGISVIRVPEVRSLSFCLIAALVFVVLPRFSWRRRSNELSSAIS